jgi:putative folate metabolism gamma-glutamate ligase
MQVTSIHTDAVTVKSVSLFALLDKHVSVFPDKSILAVTSKIVSLCEGRVVDKEGVVKEELAEEEAELYLPASENKYGFTLAVKHNMLIPSAGIDESNANGVYVLWPQDPQKSANSIRGYLCKRFGVSHAGVIITDSRATPLRWGTTGAALSHSGFMALNDYIGKPDIFGRNLTVTKANIRDALASAAVVVMGEGSEQTPLALVENVPFVSFQDRDPTQSELEDLKISLEEDVYAAVLSRAPWQKGKKNSK